MIISPKIRGFICTTAHPEGCAAHVQEQIDYVKSKPALLFLNGAFLELESNFNAVKAKISDKKSAGTSAAKSTDEEE